MKKSQKDVLLFRVEKQTETKPQRARPVPYKFRTYLLPNDFLASRGMGFGDEVQIACGVIVEQGQLAALETSDKLVFIGYIKINKDESADLYGPEDYEPYLTYQKGEYEIVGPVDKTLSRLTEIQTQLDGKSKLAILMRCSNTSLGD